METGRGCDNFIHRPVGYRQSGLVNGGQQFRCFFGSQNIRLAPTFITVRDHDVEDPLVALFFRFHQALLCSGTMYCSIHSNLRRGHAAAL